MAGVVDMKPTDLIEGVLARLVVANGPRWTCIDVHGPATHLAISRRIPNIFSSLRKPREQQRC